MYVYHVVGEYWQLQCGIWMEAGDEAEVEYMQMIDDCGRVDVKA